MGFLSRLLRRPSGETAEDEVAAAPDERQEVTVWVRLFDPAFEATREQQRVFALEDRLMRALDASGTGTHDTNDIERGYFAIRLLGPDADTIAAAITPSLVDLPEGSYVTKRLGPTGTSEERIEL